MIGVIIVSWNVRDLLRGCLQSVIADFGDTPKRIIVVDSASSDGSADMVRKEFPQVELSAHLNNIGYVKGNNEALRRMRVLDTASEMDYVWLLNPDTYVHPGCVNGLRAFMDSHPKCGMCGPKLLNADGTLQHGAFAFPGIRQLMIDTQPRLARFRESRLDGRYSSALYAAGKPFEIGHPLGAAMFARVAAIRQVGLLDEGFDMYCEEIDWALRMAQLDWQRWCVPTANVTHYSGASSSQSSARTRRILWTSRIRYYNMHYDVIRRAIATRLAEKEIRKLR